MPEEVHHRYTASLRVFSRTLEAADLTRALGEPTKTYDAGDPVSQRRPNTPKRDRAMWLRKSGLDEAKLLDRHIEVLLDVIDDRREQFEAIRQECEISIFCGIFSSGGQGGFTLEPELTRRVADLRLAVGFDIY